MTSALAGTRARPLLFCVLIGGLPFSDFLQNSVVAFNAGPIMGDISAGPEEFSLVATLYALVAIAVIASHRWALERLGWRTLVRCTVALYAAGALVCARSDSLAAFTVGRVVMACGSASFLTAARVLVNLFPPSPRRFTAIRFLAAGVAWGGVLGPLLAAVSLAGWSWRYAFYAMLVPAGLLAWLGELTLPDERMERRSRLDPVWTVVLLGACLLVLRAFQRSGFDFFADPRPLLLAAALGLAALAAAVRLGARHRQPVLRLRDMVQPRFLLGLTMFGFCYTLLGADNAMLPLLMLRGMGLPQQVVGVYLAIGALGGVAIWITLARLLPRHPGPSRYYLLAFGLLLACSLQLSSLSESADPVRSVLPALVCHGAFIISALSTTAMQAFQTLQHDETTFSHANQVKNMLAQLGVASGVAVATLGLQWRSTVHYVRLGEVLPASSPALREWLGSLGIYLATVNDPAAAARQAVALVGITQAQEATLLGALDYFVGMSWLAGACLVVIVVERTLREIRRVVGRRRAV